MPDLINTTLATCESNRFWGRLVPSFTEPEKKYLVRFERVDEEVAGVLYDYTCTCADFYYRHRYCKHIKSVAGERCGWYQTPHGDCYKQDPETHEPCCFKCGEPVEFYRAEAV